MTITRLNEACAPYEMSGRTTLGTVARQTTAGDVESWISKCLALGADYDTALNEIEDICGWQLCPFEGERLLKE